MEQCNCYHERTKKVQDFFNVRDFIDVKYGVCYGTKECEECNCGGDESKCSFYPEKRKAAEKMLNTAQMWLKAQEDGKTYIVKQQTLAYSKQRGLFYANDLTPYNQLDNFKNLTIDEFLSLEWKEMQEEIMTKVEAETKFGIKIVD